MPLASANARGRGQGSRSPSQEGRSRAWALFPAAALLLGAAGALLLVLAAAAGPGTTARVSVASDGTQSNADSWDPALSGDGRFVAFHSYASNLVPGDTNGTSDIFVHDRGTGATARVSLASDGTQGNGGSWLPAISGDGRFVAFHSEASNLVPGDTNGVPDIFVHDRGTGATARVSLASDGTQGNGWSDSAAQSGDGRFVAFNSGASNLVPGDTNGVWDVFVHDRQTGATARVSVASDGAQGNYHSFGPALSGDGRFVAFRSLASNLVAGDTNGDWDVFVHDRGTGATARVSLASDGTQGNAHSVFPALSGDGRLVAFTSIASNLVPGDTNGIYDVFVHDRQTGTTTRVSLASDGTQGNDWSDSAALSGDGRLVAFYSFASNLVPGDTNGAWDIFVHDRGTGATERVSVASDGAQGNGGSRGAALSGDGRFVAFHSAASNLVPGDTNDTQDVFVHDRQVLAFVLTPATATNPVGTPHTVTITVTQTVGGVPSPVPGVTVSFTVSGAPWASGSCVTVAIGQCPFTYTSWRVGTHTITATATVAGEPQMATASKTWGPAPPPAPTPTLPPVGVPGISLPGVGALAIALVALMAWAIVRRNRPGKSQAG